MIFIEKMGDITNITATLKRDKRVQKYQRVIDYFYSSYWKPA